VYLEKSLACPWGRQGAAWPTIHAPGSEFAWQAAEKQRREFGAAELAIKDRRDDGRSPRKIRFTLFFCPDWIRTICHLKPYAMPPTSNRPTLACCRCCC
jgi:hypothetical protein